jgi:hypothetical protein
LALVLGIFLLADGPVWENPFDIDRQVYLSYLAIPLLVILAFAWRRAWSLRWLFLDTLEVLCLKFGISYGIAILLWAFSGGPRSYTPVAPSPDVRKGAFPQRAPPATLVPAANKAMLAIDVVGLRQKKVFVYVHAGLDHLRFTPPSAPQTLWLGAGGLAPPWAVLQTWQAVQWSSPSGELHTAYGTGVEGQVLFNVPVMPGNRGALHRFTQALGLVRVQCSAHKQHPGAAVAGRVLVLHHPFARVIDGDARVQFAGVPKGKLVLALWSEGGGLQSHEVNHVGASLHTLSLGAETTWLPVVRSTDGS